MFSAYWGYPIQEDSGEYLVDSAQERNTFIIEALCGILLTVTLNQFVTLYTDLILKPSSESTSEFSDCQSFPAFKLDVW